MKTKEQISEEKKIPVLLEDNPMNDEELQEMDREARTRARVLCYVVWALLLAISILILCFILK